MRHRAWGLLLLVPLAMYLVVVIGSPFPSFHQELSAAGTRHRFAAAVVHAGRADARGALWMHNVFAVSWLLTVPRLLRVGLQRWAPERRRMFGWWSFAPQVAIGAGLLAILQNAIALASVGKTLPSSIAVLTIAAITWTKWILFLGGLVGIAGLVVGPLTAPVVRPALRRLFGVFDGLAGTHPRVTRSIDEPAVASETSAGSASDAGLTTSLVADPDRPVPHEIDIQPVERIGICVSGGGVRAASVALGALRSLDRPSVDGSPSVFQRSSWLSAVSGGAYTAGGWRISRGAGPNVDRDAPIGTTDHDGLFDAGGAWPETIRQRRRFLDNGTMSLAGGIVGALARTIVVLGAVLSVAFIAGSLMGRLVHSHLVHADFPFDDVTRSTILGARDLVPLRLVMPGAILAGAALIVAVAAFTRSDAFVRTRWLRACAAVGALGLGLLVLLVGVPFGVLYGRRFVAGLPTIGRADEGAGVLGILSSIGIIGAVTGVIVSQVKRRWLRLGGVALALAVTLFAGKAADVQARGYESIWRSWPLPFTSWRLPVLVVAVLWVVAIDCVASHRLTLGGLYRKRIAGTFALQPGSHAPLPPVEYGDEHLWPTYLEAPGPELIICATAHTTRRTFCGVNAFGFTFRAGQVTLFDRTDGTSATVETSVYPTGSWWDGYPRGWIVTRSMALTGAAFASAMGRQALGTTNALLAALNLRLGAWVPNPRFPQWFADQATSPRVHLGYLVKELFRSYHPESDPFVYVADGGHRENLGLVELLRERPESVFCIDASGDQPWTFQTLLEAIELAETELGVDIDIDLGELRRANGQMPLDCVAVGRITYPEGSGAAPGRLFYGRYQLSEAAAPALLQYGAAEQAFPNYSTADQYLTDEEHLQLVALGEHVGDRLLSKFAAVAP